jgi:hypothetical protein
MKKTIYIHAFLLFGLSEIVSASNYELPNIFEQTNNGLGMSAVVARLSYREPNVKEYGFVYGLALDLKNVFYKKLYTDLYGDFTTGKITYDGMNQLKYEPRKSKVEIDLSNIDGKLGVILLDSDYFQLIPYGGLGFHYWQRGTNQATIYRTTYYNFKAIGGARINFALSDKAVLSPYFNIGTTFGSHVKFTSYYTDFTPNGKFDLHLDNKIIYETGLEINYKLDDQIFLMGTLSYSRFGYGESESKPLLRPVPLPNGKIGNSTSEPNSKTNEIKFGIGMRFGFV